MVLIQHLFDISSLRQTHQRIKDTLSYRWLLGYSQLNNIPLYGIVN
ncbi:MAG: transposase [Clostridiales bacterium]|nr:transposase [Clostridiales bacterium]